MVDWVHAAKQLSKALQRRHSRSHAFPDVQVFQQVVDMLTKLIDDLKDDLLKGNPVGVCLLRHDLCLFEHFKPGSAMPIPKLCIVNVEDMLHLFMLQRGQLPWAPHGSCQALCNRVGTYLPCMA